MHQPILVGPKMIKVLCHHQKEGLVHVLSYPNNSKITFMESWHLPSAKRAYEDSNAKFEYHENIASYILEEVQF